MSIYIYIHTYTYTHMHTDIHIYTYTRIRIHTVFYMSMENMYFHSVVYENLYEWDKVQYTIK